ncbi:hypothetical protein [Streptomyces sp. NPDC002533]
MGEQRSVRNEFSGDAYGPVVQAGGIGKLVLNPPPPGLPPEDLATYQRLLAREVARANAEDAHAQALRAEEDLRARRMGKARRRKWWYALLFLIWGAVGGAYFWSRKFPDGPAAEFMMAWTAVMAVILILLARASYEARYGHRLPWSALFR